MPNERPTPSSASVSARMSGQARRDTEPEVALRRLLHARGMRYRVHYPVPTRPRRTIDVAFTRAKVAVFVDGCFWHGCPEHGTWPRSNAQWWATKIGRNRERDADTDAVLAAAGWTVVRLWEHESPEAALAEVAAEVARAREAVETAGAPDPPQVPQDT